MDKKPIRNSVANKADVNNSNNTKHWPRNGRRRESTNHPKSQDQPVRANPGTSNTSQQFKHNFDRRSTKGNRNYGPSLSVSSTSPLSTASGSGLVAAGAAAVDDDEDEWFFLEAAELNSVLLNGSKKHNLNHLLNFHYTPRDRDVPVRGGGRRTANDCKSFGFAKKTASSVTYNKEHFIQANCQFVVRDDNYNYLAHWNCPDVLVDWQQIEEVIIRSSEQPQCPICLYEPVAAKMTKCGHVYCWPCILHYLALSDKEWRKCPICYDPIQGKDLRSAVSSPYHEYQMTETVDFHLMRRRKGSMQVIKVDESVVVNEDQEVQLKHFPHLFDIRGKPNVHVKLILANNVEVQSIVDRERCELMQQMETEGPNGFDCPETMFVQQAIDLLRSRELAIGGPPKGETMDRDVLESVQARVAKVQLHESDEIKEDGKQVDDPEDAYYYFYQAVDGQYLYLHSVNIRMLQAEYGSLANCPRTLSGRIVQKETFSVTEEIRKRVKYLQHLPITCTFTIAEIQFNNKGSGGGGVGGDMVISKTVMASFADELNQRKRKRQKKAREERLRDKQIDEVHDRQMGKLLTQQVEFQLESPESFPMCGIEDMLDAGSSSVQQLASGEGTTNSAPRFSFAKMIQCTSKVEQMQPDLWPSLAKPIPSSNSVSKVAATPTTPVKSAMDRHFPNLLDTIAAEEAAATEAAIAITVEDPQPVAILPAAVRSPKPVGGNKRQKKKQQLLLFSTEMNFKSNN